MICFISIIFCCSVWWPKWWANVAPQTFCPGCVSSEIPSPPLTLSSSWLLCQIIERWPPKADAPPISLFYDACCFVAPNKGTSHRDCKPSAGRLQWTARWFGGTAALSMERGQHQWIGQRRLLILIVVCCVCVCGCVLCVGAIFSYQTGWKSTSAKVKWPTFAHSYHKICT